MRGRELIPLAISAALLYSWGTARAHPTIDQNASRNPSPNTLIVPPPVYVTPTPNLEDQRLLTPAVRADAMIATAIVAATKGPEGLIKEGFPAEAISSQRDLISKFRLKFTLNGREYTYSPSLRMDATIMRLDGTPFSDYILVPTAGHGFDAGKVDELSLPFIHEEFGDGDVKFEETELLETRLGKDLVLKRNEFGLASQFNKFDKTKNVDYAFLAILKANIPPVVLAGLMKDAIPFSSISFSQAYADESFYGRCTPINTNYMPVPAEGASYIGPDGRTIIISPWMTWDGCSGSGTFTKNSEGQVSLAGINVANYWDTPGESKFASIYPFSDMGQQGFLEAVQEATSDFELPAKAP
jgi:hypothetical protein